MILFSDWLFPRAGGREDRLAKVVETVRHIEQAGGVDVVAFGSDFDGRRIRRTICASQPTSRALLAARETPASIAGGSRSSQAVTFFAG